MRLLADFKRFAPNVISGTLLPTTRLEWLAAMQHHGAPTRLLDFTYSPFVAAYFAVEHGTDEGVIWGVNASLLTVAAARCLLRAGQVTVAEQETAIREWLIEDATEGAWRPQLVVAPIQLTRLSPRQAAQQALFLVPGDVERTFAENLIASFLGPLPADQPSGADQFAAIRAYVIPAGWRSQVLSDLRVMNISRASLFPGLDGFAQSLRVSLREEPDPVRRARAEQEDRALSSRARVMFNLPLKSKARRVP